MSEAREIVRSMDKSHNLRLHLGPLAAQTLEKRIAAALAAQREKDAAVCDDHKEACLMARNECDRSTAEGAVVWCCHDRAAKVVESAAAAIRAGGKP